MKRKPLMAVLATACLGLTLVLWGCMPSRTVTTLGPDATASPSHTPSPSPTYCLTLTPELLAVEPVTSPTTLLSQIVTVGIGRGEAVTITAESGTFTTTGSFGAYGNPALVDVALLVNTTHNLQVLARVKPFSSGGCQYSGYTLSTTRDKLGAPLVIIQTSDQSYLPAVVKNTTPTPVSRLIP